MQATTCVIFKTVYFQINSIQELYSH